MTMGFRMNKDDINSFNVDSNKQAFIKVYNYLATHDYEKMELNFENGSSMTIQICEPTVKIKLDDIIDEKDGSVSLEKLDEDAAETVSHLIECYEDNCFTKDERTTLAGLALKARLRHQLNKYKENKE